MIESIKDRERVPLMLDLECKLTLSVDADVDFDDTDAIAAADVAEEEVDDDQRAHVFSMLLTMRRTQTRERRPGAVAKSGLEKREKEEER